MELASYIYAAWAHEQASQDSCDRNCDQVCITLPTPPVIGKWQACLLTAIAITNVGSFGWSGSATASHVLEPAVNTAPWCDHLYLCQTEYILEVQTLLAQRGFDVGEIDGVYGRNTKQAVIEFQNSQNNLLVDGIPGQQTLAALRNFPSPSQPQTRGQTETTSPPPARLQSGGQVESDTPPPPARLQSGGQVESDTPLPQPRLPKKTQVKVTPFRNRLARTNITRQVNYRPLVIVRSVTPHNLRNRQDINRNSKVNNSSQNNSQIDHNSS